MKQFDTVEKALDELKQGHLILVTDEEDRENEGDLICAASFATTENVNFMATHAKGLICMPMSAEICRKLQFPQMVMDNTDNHETAFTVSIDHKTTTTGISAEDAKNVIIAYEPVWAIGTGKTATADQAEEVCGFIRKVVANKYGKEIADGMTIQYGGSMNEKNCAELLAKEDIDGGLIGGASLVAEKFGVLLAEASK